MYSSPPGQGPMFGLLAGDPVDDLKGDHVEPAVLIADHRPVLIHVVFQAAKEPVEKATVERKVLVPMGTSLAQGSR